jgi:hypothetical protein
VIALVAALGCSGDDDGAPVEEGPPTLIASSTAGTEVLWPDLAFAPDGTLWISYVALHEDDTMATAEADRVAYPDAIVTAAAAWARYLGPASDRETLMTVAGRLQPFVEADYRAARAGASLYAALGETRLENHARSMMAVLARERDPNAAP